MRSFLVPEPDLIFKDKTTCADPRVGLLNYKPNGLEHDNLRIPIGIIGSKKSINAAIDFLSLLQYSSQRSSTSPVIVVRVTLSAECA